MDLDALAARVSYIGSPEHKDVPSFAGHPKPRADASICDPSLANERPQLTEWLQAAIRAGQIGGPWEAGLPRYVWYRDGETVFEGRLVNRDAGEYKGYALMPTEEPEGI